ncbi:MAG TPA: hypothetical protein VGO59_18320 [Verrucomicrobiae bacterium]
MLFAILCVALGGVTFTRAAEDPEPVVANIGPQPASINAAPAAPLPLPKSSSGYALEYVKQTSLLDQLARMKTNDYDGFIQALSITSPDAILNSLLAQQLDNEIKLAALRASPSKETPQIRKGAAITREIKQKIKQRADGILAGMSIQANAFKAAAAEDLGRYQMQSVELVKIVEEWSHRRVLAKADYLEYSNLLSHLQGLPRKELTAALTTAFSHQTDSKMADVSERLQAAKAKVVQAESQYGPNSPIVKAAQKELENARSAYETKIDDVLAGIRSRVNEDQAYLAIIDKELGDAKDRLNMELEKEKSARGL